MTQAYTHRFTEVHELFGADVDVYTPGTTTSLNYRSLGNHQRAIGIVWVGEMQAGATVDVQMWQATSQAGANAKVVPGKAITQLTQAGGDSWSVVIIEVRTEEMDVDGGFSYLGGVLTVGVNSVQLFIIGFGCCSNYVPVPTTAWTEIID